MIEFVVFRRIKTRELFKDVAEWKKGHEFASYDYDFDPKNGYAVDVKTRQHHDMSSLELVK